VFSEPSVLCVEQGGLDVPVAPRRKLLFGLKAVRLFASPCVIMEDIDKLFYAWTEAIWATLRYGPEMEKSQQAIEKVTEKICALRDELERQDFRISLGDLSDLVAATTRGINAMLDLDMQEMIMKCRSRSGPSDDHD
jgi:hypothetical protein